MTSKNTQFQDTWTPNNDSQPKKSPYRVYCCVSNCHNHTQTLDERTGHYVRLHKFPDPVREMERCQHWLNNIQRADLHLGNIRHKKVCSAHFEVTAYNCPSDIGHSSLLPQAAPTIINNSFHSKSSSSQRKPHAKKKLESPPTDDAHSKLETQEAKAPPKNQTSEIQDNDILIKLEPLEREDSYEKENDNNETLQNDSFCKLEPLEDEEEVRRKQAFENEEESRPLGQFEKELTENQTSETEQSYTCMKLEPSEHVETDENHISEAIPKVCFQPKPFGKEETVQNQTSDFLQNSVLLKALAEVEQLKVENMKLKMENDKLKGENRKLQKYQLNRKVKRTKDKCVNIELAARRYVEHNMKFFK